MDRKSKLSKNSQTNKKSQSYHKRQVKHGVNVSLRCIWSPISRVGECCHFWSDSDQEFFKIDEIHQAAESNSLCSPKCNKNKTTKIGTKHIVAYHCKINWNQRKRKKSQKEPDGKKDILPSVIKYFQ